MNVLIVEDESYTADLLQEIIEQDQEVRVTSKLESVVEAVEYLINNQGNLDLLFFDIQLADGQSFEIFKHVDITTPVVFCTAYDEYTLEAIKNNGIDYILKPFKEEEIHQAIEKYRRLAQNLQAKMLNPILFQSESKKQYQHNFLTQWRERSIVQKVENIAMFSLENEIVYLYTYSGEKYPLFKKMEYIESVCDPEIFFRINRQMLVNRDAVVYFEPYFKRKIILHLKINPAEHAIVSRLKVTAFKEWLEH